jgi:ribose transport system ATP-binding protein
VVPAVSVANLTKTFGGTKALDGISIDFWPGEIHGVVGQNGAGKSTLFKILAGVYTPDHGARLKVKGEAVQLPIHIRSLPRLGFRFVHQDLGLAGSMTVLENLGVAGFQIGWFWRIKWSREIERARDVLADFGLRVRPEATVDSLLPAERASVAIARALEWAKSPTVLLVLDEPTAYLPLADRERLFDVLRRIAQRGIALAITSHRIDEIRSVCDRITVLRDGRVAARFDSAEASEENILEALLGRALAEDVSMPTGAPSGPVVLSVRGLRGGHLNGVTFDLHRGEVLGVTGLVGSGQDDIPYLLYGTMAASDGTVEVDGHGYAPRSPSESLRRGIGLLPADRQRDSGVSTATLQENVTLPGTTEFWTGSHLDRRREKREVIRLLDQFSVKFGRDPAIPLGSLSGGNQQRTLLAKWLRLRGLAVLILHEPTQGVDVGARQALLGFLRQAATQGLGLVLVSTEYDDLAKVCDRILIMQRGELAGEMQAPGISTEAIVERCYVTRRNSTTRSGTAG